ncbi:hypothetical protein BU24DRAFT_491769 [Aaosphaeria arxii CBS 175.79]|uniref:ADF-H domain-containing protein n=1 Tax=Aaosphaeria arxii CBS 175.79 TaxID=1450172 RepID=A0A6A5XRL0_9PLEO|nr:uncharacterized protein BU24DRAFT_491769 [Aaosphaeria arxii CBS 175.79]KAF2015536.1 hypothetical protein BU24DRAFT_491769 [Aaosphaeria arxii CBS 175.79]
MRGEAELSPSAREAYDSFLSDTSLFALPFRFTDGSLQSLEAVYYPQGLKSSFQNALAELDAILDPKTSLFLVIRRNVSVTAITFVPYLAEKGTRQSYIDSRHDFIRLLGEKGISSSIICKEVGEITDVRAWNERDGDGDPWMVAHHSAHTEEALDAETKSDENAVTKDLGHRVTKCRLCDRRMRNQIEQNAVEALKNLNENEDCVQLSVDITTEKLVLNFQASNIAPDEVAARIPKSKPSYTFYRHPASGLLYFINSSPDAATVKERMTHTMAVPGLVNIIAKEQGAATDRKVEIHDPEDLMFEENDETIGRFRSIYLLNKSVGTESVWEGMPVA